VRLAASGDTALLASEGFAISPFPGVPTQIYASTSLNFDQLHLSPEAFTWIVDTLAYTPGTDAYASLQQTDQKGWGQFEAGVTWTISSEPIPEPSTFALMSLGLIGAVFAVRASRR
jgi:PEP-CTERM motif